jgi:hypothetical protein
MAERNWIIKNLAAVFGAFRKNKAILPLRFQGTPITKV